MSKVASEIPILKRLRLIQGGYGQAMGVKGWLCETCGEAVTEIERLRAALVEIKSIAIQAEIYATGRTPRLDPAKRFAMIADAAELALSPQS
jgi:hypothetical protein